MTELTILHSRLLASLPGVRHAFFTRRGGVSTGVYGSLNTGQGSRDDPEAVRENRARAAAALSVAPDALLTCYQIHSALAVTARAPWAERPEADAVATDAPALACGALSADCAPVLIADPEAKVVAAAHAGWKGALGGVVEAAIQAMERLGAQRDRMTAAVGPCIGPKSYEVGLDFLERFTGAAPDSERYFQPGAEAGKRLFDLPGFVLHRLAEAGVNRAEWIGHDTCAEEDLFFSNRRGVLRGDPDYGRLLSAIVLEA